MSRTTNLRSPRIAIPAVALSLLGLPVGWIATVVTSFYFMADVSEQKYYSAYDQKGDVLSATTSELDSRGEVRTRISLRPAGAAKETELATFESLEVAVDMRWPDDHTALIFLCTNPRIDISRKTGRIGDVTFEFRPDPPKGHARLQGYRDYGETPTNLQACS